MPQNKHVRCLLILFRPQKTKVAIVHTVASLYNTSQNCQRASAHCANFHTNTMCMWGRVEREKNANEHNRDKWAWMAQQTPRTDIFSVCVFSRRQRCVLILTNAQLNKNVDFVFETFSFLGICLHQMTTHSKRKRKKAEREINAVDFNSFAKWINANLN